MKNQICRTCCNEFTPAKKSQRYCAGCSVCSVVNCGRSRGKKSYCDMHYDRFITTGNLGGPYSMVVEAGGACSVDGCQQVATAAGKCNMHYKRVRVGGTAGTYQRKRALVGSGIDAKGYRIVRINGEEHKEHRVVMAKKLGRPLLPNENVHHLDGDKLNNDLSNLELWVKTQPCGQRATDKVKAAIKLIKEYPELASEEGYRLVALESQEATDLFGSDEQFHNFSGTTSGLI